MGAALDRVVTALERAGSRRQGRDWTCPAHDDRRASLTVSNGDERVLVNCHVGCAVESVVSALGLGMRDLFDEPRVEASSRIVAAYDYTDEHGALVYQVVRREPKAFAQRRPDGRGGWAWSLGDVRRVLYRLPEVLAAVAADDTVWIVEGERDADAIAALQLVATTSPGGAGKWRADYAEALRGATDVRIVADRDPAGYRHARDVRDSLARIGIHAPVYEAVAGKDVSDHLAAGHSLEDLAEIDIDAQLAAASQVQPPVRPTLEPDPCTDAANARRFAEQHRDDLRYVRDEGVWRAWSGRRWAVDQGEITGMQLAKATARSIYAEAAREPNTDRRAALGKWAAKSESADRLRAMLALARSEPEIVASSFAFDAHPNLFNSTNGTLDLDRLELHAHRREDLLTVIAAAAYEPDAHSDLWDQVLERALPNPEARRYLQKLAGYALDGRKRLDVIGLLHGPTRSAKGTVQSAIARAFGEYAATAELDALAERRRDDVGTARPELVRLRGVRIVSIYETGRRLRLDAALVKSIAGSDPITARALYSSPITFMPQFVAVLASNYRPRLPDDDDAVWERVREIPFGVQIPEAERDPRVREQLSDPAISGTAVLAWAVDGLRLIRDEGFAPPDVVRAATADYRSEMDPVSGFFETACIFEPDSSARASDLRKAYEQFCHDNGERALGGKEFAARLRARGCVPERAHGGRLWRGLRIEEGGA